MWEKTEVPYQHLSKEALHGALEEYVLRENAESGHGEISLGENVAQVKVLLESGKAKIVFDEETKTHSIIRCDI